MASDEAQGWSPLHQRKSPQPSAQPLRLLTFRRSDFQSSRLKAKQVYHRAAVDALLTGHRGGPVLQSGDIQQTTSGSGRDPHDREREREREKESSFFHFLFLCHFFCFIFLWSSPLCTPSHSLFPLSVLSSIVFCHSFLCPFLFSPYYFILFSPFLFSSLPSSALTQFI